MRARDKFITGTAMCVAFGTALLSTAAVALPTDPQQPIEIEAGNAMRDERQGLTVYEQNVTIRQGSILINADRVSVHTAGNQVNRIVATGQPANYQQQPKPGDSPVVARANTIEYQLASDQIQLLGNASLEQAGTTLTGNRIDYDLRQEIIRASGDDTGTGRIRMVIPPGQQQPSQPQTDEQESDPQQPGEEDTAQ